MRFAQPLGWMALALVPILVGFSIWALRRRRRDLRRFLSAELVGRLAFGRSMEREVTKTILIAAGLLLLSLALARPQWGMRLEPMVVRGIDIIIALDASDSMLAEDLRPNRLARAKSAAVELIERLPLDRVGVVGFAGSAEVECPLTPDHEAARMFLDTIDPRRVSVAGTALGEAIRTSMAAFGPANRRLKVIVIITDGEDHQEEALKAAREAADQGAVIYTLGVGSGRGEPVPVRSADGSLRGYKKDAEGRVVTSQINETLLSELARAGRGRYYRLSGDQQEVSRLSDEIAAFERQAREVGQQSRREDRYQLPLAAAFLLLGLEALLADRRRGVKARTGIRT